jgi:TatA/E family protein of Tat protein translocase
LALDPLELGIIGIMAVVLFLWGPQKIPDLARALGKAKKEFDTASKEFAKAANIQGTGADSLVGAFLGTAGTQQPSMAPRQPITPMAPITPAPAPPPPANTSGDELLIDTARKLGISTQGKTREQVQKEIIDLAKKAPDKPAPSGTSVPS